MTEKLNVRAIILILFLCAASTAFADLKEVIEKAVSPVQSDTACVTNDVPEKDDVPNLNTINTISMRYCFDNHASVKLTKGNVLQTKSVRCEIPMDMIIHCKSSKFRNVKVKEVKYSFANTKSSSHIPPRGWTSEIILDRMEEEVQEGPEKRNIRIKCFSGEKMLTRKRLQSIFGEYISLD